MNIEQPIDLVKYYVNEKILMKCKQGIQLKGTLQAFDTHFNVLLTEVEETKVRDQESQIKSIKMLYVRGDTIIMITKQTKDK